jgi:hypothetical protein
MLQMANGSKPNEGLRDRINRDGSHDPHVDISAGFYHASQHQAIGYRCDHPDIIGFRALDAPLFAQLSPKYVASTYNYAYLNAQLVKLQYFISNMVQ